MKKKDKARPTVMQAKQPPFIERHARPLLGAILLLALGLRMAALWDLSRSVYVDFLLWDERVYHEIAVKIANGTFAGKEVYPFAPLFAYLTAGIYRLLSPDVFYIRLLNILFGVLLCWAVYGIGARLGGKRVGLLAALLAALYKPFLLYSIVPLKEAASALLFAATARAILQAISKKGKLAAALAGLAGLAAGLLLNVRPNAIVLAPLLFVLIPWYRRRDGAPFREIAAVSGLFLLGLWLAVSPFVIRNCIVAGKFALATSQSGFNLYLGNNLKNPVPYYRPVPFATSSPYEQGAQFTIEASRRAGRALTSQEASDFWTKEVLRQAFDQPGAFARKLGLKTLALMNRFEACDHYDIDFLSGVIPFFRIPFFPGFPFVFPLAMAALALFLFKDSNIRLLGLILAVYGATVVLYFPNARYRLPMVSLLIPLAALGIAALGESLRKREFRRASLMTAAALVFAAIAFLPVPAADDRTAYFNTHAIILDSRGFQNEAILYWRRSSEMNRPFSAFANLSLAQKAFLGGNLPAANGWLGRIPDDSFAAAAKYALMGDLLARQQRIDEAARAYERSLEINSGQRRTLVRLIEINRLRDPQKAARDESRLKAIDAFYPKRNSPPTG